MKLTFPLILTHALVLAGGYGLHWAAATPVRQSVTPPVERQIAKAPARPSAGISKIAGASPWSASEFRKAWQSLGSAKIPPAELALLRAKILREWAFKDLRSALIAWSDAETLNSSEVSNAIQSAFDGHEEEMLDWINAGDFGLDGSVLLFSLAHRINDNTPELMLKLLPKVPEEFQARVMESLFGQFLQASNADKMDERIVGIATLPDARLRSLAWDAVMKGMASRNDPRFHEFLSREDLPAEVHRAALESFADSLARQQLPAKAMEEFRKLSADDQSEMGPSLLAQAEKLSFALPMAVTNALTMLAESGQWELLKEKGPNAVDHYLKSSKPNPEAVSRWALQLPAREETAGTFRSAVAARFREDLAAGEEWIRSLPEGWHRQQALAQLAMTAQIHHKDPATRARLMGEITESAILAELKEWQRSQAAEK